MIKLQWFSTVLRTTYLLLTILFAAYLFILSYLSYYVIFEICIMLILILLIVILCHSVINNFYKKNNYFMKLAVFLFAVLASWWGYRDGEYLFAKITIIVGADCDIPNQKAACVVIHTDSRGDTGSGGIVDRLALLKTDYDIDENSAESFVVGNWIVRNALVSFVVIDKRHILIKYVN
jgi:hypothetical protein